MPQALRPEHRPWAITASAICFLCPGLIIFFVNKPQHTVLQQRVRQHLFQLGVLPLQFLQPFGLVDLHHAKLTLPTVEGLLRDALLLADLHDALAAIDCPQNADLVLGRMSFAFHRLGPLYWPRLTPMAAQKFGVTSDGLHVRTL